MRGEGVPVPRKGPLQAKEVQSTYKAVAQPLMNLGFVVETIVVPDEASVLHDLFEQVLNDLAGRVPRVVTTVNDAKSLVNSVESDIPSELNRVLGLMDEEHEAHGSAGQTYLAEVPWAGIFNKTGSGSAKDGIYLVYLFAADGSRVYLSLNQGTENVTGGTNPIKKRALDLWAAAGSPEDDDMSRAISLASVVRRPRNYEAGNAVAFEYQRGAVPKHLIGDLALMLSSRSCRALRPSVRLQARAAPSFVQMDHVSRAKRCRSPQTGR